MLCGQQQTGGTKDGQIRTRGRFVNELAKTSHVVRNVDVADGNETEFPP